MSKTALDLIKNVPELSDILERLEETDKAAQEAANSNNKAIVADHFLIVSYYAGGRWNPTYASTPRKGKEMFIQELDKQVDQREKAGRNIIVQGVEIKITRGKGSNRNKTAPEYAKIFFDGATPLSGLDEESKKLDALKDLAVKSNGGNGELPFNFMLEFEKTKLELKHQRELSDLQAQIRDLQRDLADEQEYAAELEEELGEKEGALSGFQSGNTDMMKEVIELGKKAVDYWIFDGKEDSGKGIGKGEDGSSYSEGDGEGFSLAGLDGTHKEDMIKFFTAIKALPVDQFGLVYKIIANLQVSENAISKTGANRILAFIQQAKEKAEAAAKAEAATA